MNQIKISDTNCKYVRLDESIEFFCYRCQTRKISKKYAEYDDGSSKHRICNACYGFLKSNAGKNDK